MTEEELSGLQWLSRERPEAMQHLLAFFRESARHLDPKTRFLISVVTKVVNLSERGLRQYIPRAIREGATPDEVLDAILDTFRRSLASIATWLQDGRVDPVHFE